PSQWTIIEGGPGDGTFARRVQQALKDSHPHVFEATRYELSDAQADAQIPSLYFSNELLDAFPVHRLTSEGELYVTLDEKGHFVWEVGPLSTPRLAQFDVAAGQIIEVNLAIDDWLASVVTKLNPEFVITVDYGAEAAELYDPVLRPNGTLRAFSRHQFVDNVLSAPGEYDITSSVNWTQVKATGERLGLKVVEFESQDRFLLRAGLLDALQYKTEHATTDSEKLKLAVDAREMILPGNMASSFQVLVQRRK
ncbi:MAG TPA: class I SAM-dependent methyltransferase, partial [Pyrinomonadaceae bacterium]